MNPSVKQSDASLPGGTLMSRVQIYESISGDGQRGGTPHIHLACDEMYFGLEGEGFVELISYDGFQRQSVFPGKAICFTPGTIHRAINPGGDLVILVVMQNKGLPERGDVAIPFPRDILSSPEAYREAMQVHDEASAQKRRDLGVQGFLELRQAFEDSPERGRNSLDEFYRVAIERTRSHYDEWHHIVEEGPATQVKRTRENLEDLASGSIDSLRRGHAFDVETAPDQAFGYCGRIHAYDPAGSSRYTLEGTKS